MRYRRAKARGGTYFFTAVTFDRQKFLTEPENLDLLRDAFSRTIANHPFVMDAWVILPDHMHFIWTLPEEDCDFPTRWRLIKSRFTHAWKEKAAGTRSQARIRKGERAVWQRRYWEHQIRDEADFTRHVQYIHYNPVKHGYAKTPAGWPHSSFHDFVKNGRFAADWGEQAMKGIEGGIEGYDA